MKLLLSSVFGPYGVDDAYGRKENIMELFHNQVTREQGVFSLRFHHQSFGLHMLAENVSVPSVVLDFPSEKQFIREIKKGYDYVGITFITPNLSKAQRMGRLIRKHAPHSKILFGGQGTRIPGIENLVEHDHICVGEGIKWLRALLQEDPDRPFRHPAVPSAFSKRVIGAAVKSDTAVLIPGVGCPNGCRFCCTSHFFNKEYVPYLDTGNALFETCVEIEKKLGFKDFFVIDENFLKQTDRARELVRLMEKRGKLFRFGIFSSAETIAEVGVDFLARLGVFTVWIGVESKHEIFEKNKGIDITGMVRELRDHGINVLVSGILFFEHHDRETIREDVEFMVGLEADLVQFMQLAPMPQTPLYKEYVESGRLKHDIPYEEWHGQHRIWYDHPHFTPEESEHILKEAFQHDYDANGSSLLRMCDTVIRGYRKLAKYEDPYMKGRRDELRSLAESLRPALPVLLRYAHNTHAKEKASEVIAAYDSALGARSAHQILREHAAMGCAMREISRLRKLSVPDQPRMIRTRYRTKPGKLRQPKKIRSLPVLPYSRKALSKA